MAHISRMAWRVLRHIKYIVISILCQKFSVLLNPQGNIINTAAVNRSIKLPKLCERILFYIDILCILGYYLSCLISNTVAYTANAKRTAVIVDRINRIQLVFKACSPFFGSPQ